MQSYQSKALLLQPMTHLMPSRLGFLGCQLSHSTSSLGRTCFLFLFPALVTHRRICRLTRISLSFAMARVVYNFPRDIIFRMLSLLSFCFCLLGSAAILNRCIVCGMDGAWQNQAPYICPVTLQGTILPYIGYPTFFLDIRRS